MKRTPDSASFGIFEFDFQTHELRKRGLKIHLAEQPCRVLAFLLEQPGTLVTREELRAQLWPDDTFVDFDHSLNTAIMRLRKALGDSPENPRFIETLSRRGYRFLPSVKKRTEAAEPDQATQPDEGAPQATISAGNLGNGGARHTASGSPAGSHRAVLVGLLALGGILAAVLVVIFGHSVRGARKPEFLSSEAGPLQALAVLPLENVSGDKSQQYLADGITQQLVTDLAKIRALTVISGPSAVEYDSIQQIANQVHADAVVEGTLLRKGNTVHITAELVQGSSGRYLWTGSYEAQIGDILQVENAVAQTIAEHTRIGITPGDLGRLNETAAVTPAAYDNYLKGLYYWDQRSRSGLTKATGYFRQAIGMDPNYALAYAGLADCYAVLGSTVVSAMAPQEAALRAEAAARKAIQLNAHSAEVQTVQATIQFNYDWNWTAAEAGFKRAIELNPGYATAHQRYSLFLMAMGRIPESLAEIRRAQQLEPLSISINFSLGWRLYMTRHYNQAIEQLLTTSEMDPNFALAHLVLGEAYEQKGEYKKAIAEIKKAVLISHASPRTESELGRAYAMAGDRTRAENVVEELNEQAKQEYVSPFDLASIYAALGQKDEALSWLEKSYDERANGLIFLQVDPEMDNLRSDPRFEHLLSRLHFRT